jgi:hypothetical protein
VALRPDAFNVLPLEVDQVRVAEKIGLWEAVAIVRKRKMVAAIAEIEDIGDVRTVLFELTKGARF